MQPEKRSYVVKRTNTGLGLFATKPIARGERIIEYKGPLVTDEVVYKRGGKYFFGVNTKWSIDGSPRSNVARYINHSCKPNAEALISGRRVWIWSRKNIKAGEEINYDYGKEYFEGIIEPLGCRCAGCGVKSKTSRTNGKRNRRLKRSARGPTSSVSISLWGNTLHAHAHATVTGQE